jgi:hypothetical protein
VLSHFITTTIISIETPTPKILKIDVPLSERPGNKKCSGNHIILLNLISSPRVGERYFPSMLGNLRELVGSEIDACYGSRSTACTAYISSLAVVSFHSSRWTLFVWRQCTVDYTCSFADAWRVRARGRRRRSVCCSSLSHAFPMALRERDTADGSCFTFVSQSV